MIRFLVLFFFATLPFQFALNPVSGVDLNSARVFSLGIVPLWLFVSFRRGSVYLPSLLLFFVFGFLGLAIILSLFWAENPLWGLRKLLFLLSFLPFFFVTFDLFRDTLFRIQFAKILVFGASIAAILSIIQVMLPLAIGLQPVLFVWREYFLPFFLGDTFSNVAVVYSSMLVNIGGMTILRGSAFFPDPHIASFFFGMTLPFAGAMFFFATGRKKQLFFFCGVLLLCADVATFSRGGFVALFFAALFAVFRFFPEIIRRFGNILFFGVAGIVLLLVIPNPFSLRFSSILSDTDASNTGRMAIWREAAGIIAEHPVFGVGLGNYSLAVKPSAEYREPRYAHNLFLDTAAEIGLPAALLLLGSLLWLVFRGITSQDKFSLAAGFSLVIFLAHSLFETPIFSVHIFPLLLSILAILLASLLSNKPRFAA